jgi:hypothetical protein
VIAEIAAAIGAVGAVVGWIFAFRARGATIAANVQANNEAERARISEARREAAEHGRDLSLSNEAAARAELRASQVAVELLGKALERSRAQGRDLLARLQANGTPVGDVAIDVALDGLYQDPGSAGAGADRREAGGSHARVLPDEATDPSIPTIAKP